MKLTGFSKLLIVVLIVGIIGFLVVKFAPGVKIGESKQLEGIEVNEEDVDNVTASAELPLPSGNASGKISGKPLTRIAGYAWNAQSGIIVANGGPKTTAGSLMEQNGVNLELIRQDWLTELRNLQMKFVEQLDGGSSNPSEGVFAVMIMGDGAPYYISSTQQ
ncbi:MAG: hypothetical protein AAB316_15600, partial [Bacteroidota bacterium]